MSHNKHHHVSIATKLINDSFAHRIVAIYVRQLIFIFLCIIIVKIIINGDYFDQLKSKLTEFILTIYSIQYSQRSTIRARSITNCTKSKCTPFLKHLRSQPQSKKKRLFNQLLPSLLPSQLLSQLPSQLQLPRTQLLLRSLTKMNSTNSHKTLMSQLMRSRLLPLRLHQPSPEITLNLLL